MADLQVNIEKEIGIKELSSPLSGVLSVKMYLEEIHPK